MSNKLYTLALIILTLASAQAAMADVKIKSKQTMAGQTYENTTFIKGKRQRSETMSGMMVSLTQCDLRRGIQLNPQTKTYIINPFASAAEQSQTANTSADANVVQAGGKVTMTVTTKDTGERKQMFGFTARRVIITMETESSPDACSKTKSKMQTDGWYIDAEFVLDCDSAYSSANYNTGRSGGCRDKYETKTIGAAKRGYPVWEKMTMFDESGKETYSMLTEVIELSKATLESSLFEIPQDYREAKDYSELYASASSMTRALETIDGPVSTVKLPNVSNAPGNAESSVAGPKKAGTIRIGLVEVKTGAVGEGLSASDLAAAVQNTLAQYLKAPNIEVVPIESKLASAIAAESREKECDYILMASVSHKKGKSGFGSMFGSALGTAVGHVGIGHTGSTAGNIAGQIATQAIVAAGTMSANVKAKDEVSLMVTLNGSGGQSALAQTYKAKAKSDGDDIITQVVEQAAQAVFNSAVRK